MFKLICVFLLSVQLCYSYKILVAFPYPGKSHSILGEGYVKLLLEAGHDVTYITAIPLKTPHPKLRYVDVSSELETFIFEKIMDFNMLINKEIDLSDMSIMYSIMQEIAHNSITHENVQKFLLDTKEEFDVVITEWLYSDLYSGFATVFNCPLIWSSSLEPHAMILRLIDDYPNPAYTPDHMSELDLPMTFWERVGELWRIIEVLYYRSQISHLEEDTYKKGYGPALSKRGRDLPPYQEVKYNGSMVLGNSHVSTGIAVRLPQNYKGIVGYHISAKHDPLPENFQKIMDNARNGVIYFSMGTMMKSKTMPDKLKNGLITVFGNLKQTVIWKLEETLPNLPENVHIVNWAPQQAILAHPNCVLFITHGGLLSTTEALHYGVPIIGIPLFADQFINIRRAETKGFALKVDIAHEMYIELKAAIDEVLNNPKYRQKAKELSSIYHDRPTPPGMELVHWVEHVARTRGAPHLRSPSMWVPWYQKMYLDLLAIVLLSLTIIFAIIKRFINALFFTKKNKKQKRN